MKSRHKRENTSAEAADIKTVQEATRAASSFSFLPSSRTIRLPPPTPKRLASAPAIRNTVSTREEAATMYGLLVLPMNQVSAMLYTSVIS